MKLRCLVTGGNGLLGSFLLQELQEYEIFLLKRQNAQQEFYPHPNSHALHVDLNDSNFEEALPKKIDAIIHLAQSNHFKEFPEKALDIVSVNSMSTLRLLEYGRKAHARAFIYASSGAVYGAVDGQCQEDSLLSIQSKQGLYYASKLSSEMYVESYSDYMTPIILRFFFIYGPGQRKSMLVPRLVQSVLEDKPIMLQGKDGIRINPVYVSDAAKAVRMSLQSMQSMTVNIAGPEILSLKQMGEMIGESLGKTARFDVNDMAIPRNLVGSIQKMKALLMTPQIKFKEGIQEYLKTMQPMIAF